MSEPSLAEPGTAVPDDAVPDDAAADEGSHLAVSFVRALRQAGLTVALGSAISYRQALGELDIHLGSSLYWAGRAS